MVRFPSTDSWADALTGFFDWWGRELLAVIPTRIRKAIRPRQDQPMLVVHRDEILLLRGNDPAQHVPLRRFAAADTGSEADLAPGLSGRGDPVGILVAQDAALHVRIKLAQALLENLHEAVSFQLDRFTPFTAQDAYFTCRLVSRDPIAEQIIVDLTVVPRSLVDRALKIATALGLIVLRVSVENKSPHTAQISLPIPALRRRRHAQLGLNALLAACLCFLLGTTVVIPIAHEQAIARALTMRLDAARPRAETAARLDAELRSLVRQANFLTAQKRSRPSALMLLRELTHRLPDDTWLTSAEFDGGGIIVSGESASATALIGELAASPYFRDPRFRAALTPDQETGKDHFEISADVTAPASP